ncbi:merozoite surface protein 9-like [Malaya genurostris]|uniref:merozoite surface protein 9-like n=1 Tax=Malaya genurostris TaxID=325434 RepID=UPI0026F3B40C|nr:merozoite surface protein 9-like [Malaya genurostris]
MAEKVDELCMVFTKAGIERECQKRGLPLDASKKEMTKRIVHHDTEIVLNEGRSRINDEARNGKQHSDVGNGEQHDDDNDTHDDGNGDGSDTNTNDDGNIDDEDDGNDDNDAHENDGSGSDASSRTLAVSTRKRLKNYMHSKKISHTRSETWKKALKLSVLKMDRI